LLRCLPALDVAAAPAIGQLFVVDMELLTSHDFGQKCIHCEGRVTRLEQADGEAIRVAMRLDYMDFRSLGESLPLWHLPGPQYSAPI
jgi:hypothetical protein